MQINLKTFFTILKKLQDTQRENIPQQKVPQPNRGGDFKRRRRQLLWRHPASRIDDVADVTRRRVDDGAWRHQRGAGAEQEGAADGGQLQPAQDDVIAAVSLEGKHRKFGGKLVEARLQEAQQPAEEFAEEEEVVFFSMPMFLYTTFFKV